MRSSSFIIVHGLFWLIRVKFGYSKPDYLLLLLPHILFLPTSFSSFFSLSSPYSSNSYSPSLCFSSSPSSFSSSFSSSSPSPPTYLPLGEISSYLQLNVEILDICIFGTDRPTDKAMYRGSLPELKKCIQCVRYYISEIAHFRYAHF